MRMTAAPQRTMVSSAEDYGGNLSGASVLVIDDEPGMRNFLTKVLGPRVKCVEQAGSPLEATSKLDGAHFDVLILDNVMPGMKGLDWINDQRRKGFFGDVILITAYGDVEMAVKAVKAGATDFVLKPWQNEKLLATISSALNLRYSKLEVDRLRSREKQLNRDIDQRYHDMIGVSPAIQKVFATIEKVASTDADILILGENGTGKELVARALHRQSPRAGEVFISVDMGAIAETLFESELFGHMKGAFTDAKENRPGRFELADGGTLFLDEIGNLSLAMQAKRRDKAGCSQLRLEGRDSGVDIPIVLLGAPGGTTADAEVDTGPAINRNWSDVRRRFYCQIGSTRCPGQSQGENRCES